MLRRLAILKASVDGSVMVCTSCITLAKTPWEILSLVRYLWKMVIDRFICFGKRYGCILYNN